MEDLPFKEPDIWVLKESISHELVSKHLNLYITTGVAKITLQKKCAAICTKSALSQCFVT